MMSLTCRFIMPNEEYSQEYADENHNGEESDDNYKLLWEDEFNFTGKIDSIELSKDSVYHLQGERGGETFNLPVENMKIWNLIGDNQNQIAISSEVIEKENIDLEKGVFEITFKEMSVLTNLIPGVYINITDFPKELVS
ncbi:MAG: hypothetical protein KDC84_09755 [Crocinitomicaceae bacterium]|nr:hypothetical protein [Crocinitomicaceae bacterium]